MSEPSLTTEERQELDYWFQRIPSGSTEEALWNLMRLQIKHDTAGIRTAVGGVFELQDAADDARREMVEAARVLTATADGLTERMAQTTEQIAAFMAASTSDRLDLRQRSRLHRRWLWGLTAVVVGLLVERVWHWWPIFAALLLSFVALWWGPL